MSKAHINSKLELRRNVKALDPNISELWSFDGSDRSNKFTSPLYGSIYTKVPYGRYRGGVAIEEGTTNLMTGNALKFIGWSAYGGTVVTLEQGYGIPGVTDGGATRIKTVGGSGADTHLKYYYSWGVGTAGTPASESVWVYNIGSSIVRVNGNEIAVNVLVNPGEIKLCSISKASVSGTGGRQLRFTAYTNSTDSLDFIAFQPQAEVKSFSTSYVVGTRNAGNITYPVNVKGDFTVSFWCKFEKEWYKDVMNSYKKLVGFNKSDETASILFREYNTDYVSSVPFLDLEPDSYWNSIMHHWHSTFTYVKDTWYYISLIKSGSTIRRLIYMYGSKTPVCDVTNTYIDSTLLNDYEFDRLVIYGELSVVVNDLVLDKCARNKEDILRRFLCDSPIYDLDESIILSR
jgi:hypothetical protein